MSIASWCWKPSEQLAKHGIATVALCRYLHASVRVWPWRPPHSTPGITQHCFCTAALLSPQKSCFQGNGNATNTNCSNLNCLWNFRQHKSHKFSVVVARVTHTVGELRVSAKERLFCVWRKHTTYFSFYNRVNWPNSQLNCSNPLQTHEEINFILFLSQIS